MLEWWAELSTNPIFGGLLGGSLIAGVFWLLRNIPGSILNFIMWRFGASLSVFSEDAAFERMNEWLSSLEYTKRCRRLRLTTTYDENTRTEQEIVGPGIGSHLFWYKNRPIVVRRTLPEKGGLGTWKRFEDIEVKSFGSPNLLRELVLDVKLAREERNAKTVNVYLYRQLWRLAARKPKRDLDTVILEETLKELVVSDAEWFISSRQRYDELGVPYRRGYLFEGPPGCGKTTLALALASHLKRPIYALNLGSVVNDDMLIDAVCEVPEHAILLLEDIDAAEASGTRRPAETKTTPVQQPPPGSPQQPAVQVQQAVTLSGLLNVIDAVFAREGRILIMTTNHPEKVDGALLRRGRADLRIKLGPFDRAEVVSMCRRFFSTIHAADQFSKTITCPIVAADLQEQLIQATMQPVERLAAE